LELSKQKELVSSAQSWFDGKLKTIITDSRRRYRMQLKDAKDRSSRGLSTIPSTKSTSAVDRYVERLAIEMFQDPDSISFTSKTAFDPEKDIGGRLLTQDFIYRSKAKNGMFPFFTWHQASSLAGAVDGLEAALVWWRHESYDEPTVGYLHLGQPVDKAIYDQYRNVMPESFTKVKGSNKVVTCDTWWIDQLEPGKDIIWDPTVGLLDVELGQFVRIKLSRTIDQLRSMADAGILDKSKTTDEVLKKYQKPAGSSLTYTLNGDKTVDNGKDVDLKDHNAVDLNVMFYKERNCWHVSFSLGDFADELSTGKRVKDVWFAGKNINILPVSVGYNKPKLLEQVGWAIPEIISPLEDEHANHRNNVSDAAKIAIQGRWWVEEGGDTNIDNLLNSRVVYGKAGADFGSLETNMDILSSLRADDSINSDINELIPAGLQSGARGVVPKGTNKTLGATQLGKIESDEKLGVQIVTRNETFMYKVLYLIAQLTICFETSETVLRISGNKAGVTLPTVQRMDGSTIPDLSVIDIDVDIQINAGLGSAPRYQKAQSTMQLVDWGKTHNIPVDAVSAYRQLSVLAGYGPEDLLDKTPPPPPPPPPVDHKATFAIPWDALSITIKDQVLQGIMQGTVAVNATVKDDESAGRMAEARQNGGGMMLPDRTGQVVDATGNSAMGMSEGGQQ
jgi:hypothetical protein